MAGCEQPQIGNRLSELGEELLHDCDQGRPAHHEASCQQDAAHAQRPETLHLSVAARESLRGSLQGPANSGQGHHVADKVGQAVNGVGGEGCAVSESATFPSRRPCVLTLAVEDVATYPFAHGHAQVDVQANAGDADAGIVLVLGQQERVIVVVVMVSVAGVPVAVGEPCHGSGNVSCAVGGRAPVERAQGGV